MYIFIVPILHNTMFLYSYKKINIEFVFVYAMCKKNKGLLMHNSDAISILNCAFDCPCFFT